MTISGYIIKSDQIIGASPMMKKQDSLNVILSFDVYTVSNVIPIEQRIGYEMTEDAKKEAARTFIKEYTDFFKWLENEIK